MADIHIGGLDCVGSAGCGPGWTFLTRWKPADGDGTITHLTVQGQRSSSGGYFVVAFFFNVGGDNYECRAAKSCTPFSIGWNNYVVSMPCEAGDLIGYYATVQKGCIQDTSGTEYGLRASTSGNKCHIGEVNPFYDVSGKIRDQIYGYGPALVKGVGKNPYNDLLGSGVL